MAPTLPRKHFFLSKGWKTFKFLQEWDLYWNILMFSRPQISLTLARIGKHGKTMMYVTLLLKIVEEIGLMIGRGGEKNELN